MLVHTQLAGSRMAGRKVHTHGSKDPGESKLTCGIYKAIILLKQFCHLIS